MSSASPLGTQPALAARPKLEMAYVLFMDIVSYSMLPMDDQQRILAELQETVQSSAQVSCAHADGNLIALPTGDGMALVFFGCPESPVTCALELARALRHHPEIKLRMGIHAGPVYRVADINANRNVAGGGINMAQRVMDCGDAGHVLISKELADVLAQLSTWKNVTLQDLGEAEVKHGVHIHIFNLYADDAGNPERPHKLQAAQRAEVAARADSLRRKLALATVPAIVIAGGIAGWLFYRSHFVKPLTEQDTVLLADFENKTGDPVFDDSLKEALSVQLGQSPFLNILSDRKISETLQMMGLKTDRITAEVGRELCWRSGSKAVLSGKISSLGSHYLVTLDATACETGNTLAKEQVEAASKDDVLKALREASSGFREKLGESLPSVRKYNTPPQTTTVSLKALQAYAWGVKIKAAQGSGAAIPFYKQAIELDPEFAEAYAALGAAYSDLGEGTLCMENSRKAYELREHVSSQRERFHIEGDYYDSVTGEMEKANQTYLDWIQVYPDDYLPHQNLGANYSEMGQYEKAVEEEETVLRLQPNNVNAFTALMGDYLALDQPEKANDVFEQAHKRNLDQTFLGLYRYYTAFLQDDAATMQRQVEWAMGRPGAEDALLSAESDTEAFYGRFDRARNYTHRAAQSAKNADARETAAGWQANAALREAEVGNRVQARAISSDALEMSRGRDVELQVALALARAGEIAQAEKIAAKLDTEFPRDTMMQNYWLPTIRAAVELQKNNPNQAIELLEETVPYERAIGYSGYMYPAYLRGEAYLKLRRGHEAEGEFLKVLGHRGVVLNFVIGSLAWLQLGRASAVSGDNSSARKQYQHFLELWKGADPNLPVLDAAQAEYQRLN